MVVIKLVKIYLENTKFVYTLEHPVSMDFRIRQICLEIFLPQQFVSDFISWVEDHDHHIDFWKITLDC